MVRQAHHAIREKKAQVLCFVVKIVCFCDKFWKICVLLLSEIFEIKPTKYIRNYVRIN